MSPSGRERAFARQLDERLVHLAYQPVELSAVLWLPLTHCSRSETSCFTPFLTCKALEYLMKTKSFRATKGQISLLIGTTILFLSPLVSSIFSEAMPPLLVGFSSLVAISLIGRVNAVIRHPVVGFEQNRMDVYSWFGIRKCFDLSSPIEVAVGSYGIVLKQGTVGAGFGREVIGKDQFDEFIRLLSDSTKNGGS